MRDLILCLALIIFSAGIAADTFAGGKSYGSGRVKGHIRKNGSYVKPYRKTNSDSRKYNNWSTKGNVNPYTGKKGTKNPY